MNNKYTPEQIIWKCLFYIMCDIWTAHDNCSDLVFQVANCVGNLSPHSGEKSIIDDPETFEEVIKGLEHEAALIGQNLSEVSRYMQLIKTTVTQIKEAKNE